jgi:hypothetical protein
MQKIVPWCRIGLTAFSAITSDAFLMALYFNPRFSVSRVAEIFCSKILIKSGYVVLFLGAWQLLNVYVLQKGQGRPFRD